VDVNTGQITKIWDGTFTHYGISKSGKWMVFYALRFLSPFPHRDDPPGFKVGWKLINLQTLEKKDAPEFLADPPNTFLRADDGELIPLILKPYGMGDDKVSGSPDSQDWVVANDTEIKILAADLTLLESVPAPSANLRNMMWRPDSSGLFLIYETEIYSLSIPDGNLRLVEANLITNYNSTYKWIDSQ
jgi:hypothetical protein